MENFFPWLLRMLQSLVDAIGIIFENLFEAIFDALLGIVVIAVTSLDIVVPNASLYWSLVPSGVIEVLSLVGFGEAMAIISSAILIRLGLQLIPFVRLGS